MKTKIIFFSLIMVGLLILSLPVNTEECGSRIPLPTKSVELQKISKIGSNQNVEIIENVAVTAYTDSGLTASGIPASDGIVACNFRKLGTVIQIPHLFGTRKFVILDRMNKDYRTYPRNRRGIDIWMRDHDSAIALGVRRTTILVIK